jgi:5'-nucleotidase
MRGMWRWAPSGIVLALGALVAWMALPGGAQAQYPPPTGSVTLSVSSATPAVGESVVLGVQIVSPTGTPVAGASCSFAITEQPGTDAYVVAGPVATDAAGIAATTLNVGSTPGLISVQAQCGELSAMTSVVAGAAQAVALPATGEGSMASSGGLSPWLVALAAGVVLALAAAGVRRAGSRRSS